MKRVSSTCKTNEYESVRLQHQWSLLAELFLQWSFCIGTWRFGLPSERRQAASRRKYTESIMRLVDVIWNDIQSFANECTLNYTKMYFSVKRQRGIKELRFFWTSEKGIVVQKKAWTDDGTGYFAECCRIGVSNTMRNVLCSDRKRRNLYGQQRHVNKTVKIDLWFVTTRIVT